MGSFALVYRLLPLFVDFILMGCKYDGTPHGVSDKGNDMDRLMSEARDDAMDIYACQYCGDLVSTPATPSPWVLWFDKSGSEFCRSWQSCTHRVSPVCLPLS